MYDLVGIDMTPLRTVVSVSLARSTSMDLAESTVRVDMANKWLIVEWSDHLFIVIRTSFHANIQD